MPVKLRLQRRGRKQRPHYNIVAADNRKPRDGREVEKLGFYNPNTTPATIELNSDKALKWLENGAQPTPTVDRILSYKGVKYRKHLLRGVKKGVLSQEEADEKYAQWLEEKAERVSREVQKLQEKASEEAKKRLEAEAEINKKRAEELHAKKVEAGEITEETESGEEQQDQSGEEQAASPEQPTENTQGTTQEQESEQQSSGEESAPESDESEENNQGS